MKKHLLVAFIALIASPALADGSPCEDTAKLIAQLEQDKKSASGSQLQNIKSVLAASYATLKANGCNK